MTIDERIITGGSRIEHLLTSIRELLVVTENRNVRLEALRSETAELSANCRLRKGLLKALAWNGTSDGERIRALAKIAEIWMRRLYSTDVPEISST